MGAARLACLLLLLLSCASAVSGPEQCVDEPGSCTASAGAGRVVKAMGMEEDFNSLHLLQTHLAGSDKKREAKLPTDPADGLCNEPSNTAQKVSVPEVANDADAVCNDGTPGVYYWSPASCPNSSKWLVFLGSGGWCWDAESCSERWPSSLSSKDYPDIETYDPDSIMGNHSPFHNYNRVYLRQCSSDAWMGDIGKNQSVGQVHWRGARIVRATLRHLVVDRGLAEAELLVFGGASAGARGAMVHLDTLKKFGLVPLKLPVLGLLDSPYYIEMPSFQNLTTAKNNYNLQTQLVAKNMHNEAILRGGGACNLAEAWKCGFGQYRVPLLKTPFLLIDSQYDAYGIATYEGLAHWIGTQHCYPEPQGAHYSFAGAFAGRVYVGLTTLPQVVRKTSGLYSTTCNQHAESEHGVFGKQKMSGISMADAAEQAVDAFMNPGKKMMPYVVDDTCAVLNCGQYCLSKIKADCGVGLR